MGGGQAAVFRETFKIGGITFWLMLDPGPGWTRFYLSATAPEGARGRHGVRGEREWTTNGKIAGPSYEARAVARRRAIRAVARWSSAREAG